MRAEPIVLLSFIQHDLQSAYSQRQQRESDVIEFDATLLEALQIWRGGPQRVGGKKSKKAHRQIDEENPAPGVTIGHPAAQSRSDRRGTDGGNSVQGKCQAALLRRKGVGENRLHHGLQAASTCAL